MKICLSLKSERSKVNKAEYSVWVGGVEANDYYLTEEFAKQLADLFVQNGFVDVQVKKEK
jgi:hypothetical protein